MRNIKTSFAAIVASLALAGTAFAAGGAKLESANIDPDNVQSLQRGAANFMNYCAGCHSAEYVRYSTIGKDLGLSDDMLIENLMFNAEKTFETIQVSMTAEDATRWLGAAPPDLSLTARAKTADYIYTFLKSYYLDEDRSTGVNNKVLGGTSMPHVLGGLQGYNRAVYETHSGENGSTSEEFVGFETVIPGELSPEEYDEFVRDTVNFLAYIAEPMRSERRVIGVWVLIFLTLFLVLAIMLKKEIWKDVK